MLPPTNIVPLLCCHWNPLAVKNVKAVFWFPATRAASWAWDGTAHPERPSTTVVGVNKVESDRSGKQDQQNTFFPPKVRFERDHIRPLEVSATTPSGRRP